MGGCIVPVQTSDPVQKVSSLHGRVYRKQFHSLCCSCSFLPTWEGVSYGTIRKSLRCMFPPYMGGCIGSSGAGFQRNMVSSLHGRVYRSYASIFHKNPRFPPYMGGCIADRGVAASSLKSFLPTWEGVSLILGAIRVVRRFPPYMGGCIGWKDLRLFF